MKKFNRAMMWFAMNFVFAILLWQGFVNHVEGAKNLSTVLIWLYFIGNCVALLRSKSDGERLVPVTINIIFDTSVLIFLTWFGAYWTLAIYLLGSIWNFTYYDNEIQNEENKIR